MFYSPYVGRHGAWFRNDQVFTDFAYRRNDILHRFWTTGVYEKNPEKSADNSKADACKETPSPAMDILVSSNFERLMWFLAKGTLVFHFI